MAFTRTGEIVSLHEDAERAIERARAGIREDPSAHARLDSLQREADDERDKVIAACVAGVGGDCETSYLAAYFALHRIIREAIAIGVVDAEMPHDPGTVPPLVIPPLIGETGEARGIAFAASVALGFLVGALL